MKIFSLNLLVLCFTCVFFFSCSGDDEPSKADQVRSKLTSGTWKIQSVTIGEEDGMEFFEDLALTFQKSNFTTVNGGPVWPASGSWDFTNDQATAILRGDGVEVTLVSVDETTLECTLYWNETVLGGRVKAVEGNHRFVFTK
jgi:hypothetical protein